MKRIFRRSLVKPDAARDVGDELRFHIEMRAQEFIESGMPHEEAEREARRAFGDMSAIDAELRSAQATHVRMCGWQTRWHEFASDVRFAARTLRSNWGFTAAALATLTLGIGSAIAVFTVVNGVLLRPLPYPEPERLEMLWMSSSKFGSELPLTSGFYLDVADVAKPYAQTAAFRSWGFTLTSAGDAEQLSGARVQPAFFSIVGVRPALGRTFVDADGDAGAARVAVISDALWKRRFGGDPKIVGKSIGLGGESFSVIGVMPPGFAFPRGAELPQGLQFGARTEVWTPLRFEERDRRDYGTMNLSAIARLRPDARESAFRNAAAAQIKQFLAVNAPKLDLKYHFNDLRTQAGQHVRRGLYLLLAAVALLLVIASVNVANLLIARTSSREREFAVRAALGAGRVRLARQLVTENLLLGVIGAAVGVAFAAWGTRAILTRVPGSLPRADDIGLDWRVLGVSAAVALTLAALLGLAAASQVSWRTIAGTLQQAGARSTGGRSRRLGRRMLVAAEVALSLMLLVGAALLTKSFLRIQQVNPGFNAPRTLVAGVSIPITRFDIAKDGPAWGRFFGQLLRNVAGAPGVVAAGAVSALPLTGMVEGGGTAIIGQTPSDPSQALHAEYLVIEGDYFTAMGIPLLAGRAFAPTDVADAEHVAIVNREYARKYLGKDVIGRRLTTYFDFTRTTPRTIVGMVDNVQNGALDAPPGPQIYVPEAQMTYPALTLVVRAKGDPMAMLPVVRKEVSALDPRIAVANPRTMDDVTQDALATRRFSMTLIGVFAGCALLLAMVGLYGVIALSVSQRRKELSVRMALGAQPTDIVRLVLREAFGVAALGAVLGVAGALAGSRLIAAMLFDVSSTDSLMYALAAATVIGIALAASWAPAMRARRLDPASMLRTD